MYIASRRLRYTVGEWYAHIGVKSIVCCSIHVIYFKNIIGLGGHLNMSSGVFYFYIGH